MSERHLTLSAAQLFLIDGNKVLLHRRKGGWGNGMWDATVSGHVEVGESLIDCLKRETKEEIGVRINRKDIIFINICHDNGGLSYYNGNFFVNRCSGIPRICEPDKSSELKWFNLKRLPRDLLPNRRQAIKDYIAGKTYNEIGW